MLNCRYKTTGADRILYSCLFAVMIFSITGYDSSDIANEESSDFRTWSNYLGDKGGTQYSSLDQITTENVDKLQIAWIFSTGDTISGVRTEIQANPIIIGDTLYATTPQLKLFALKAATGELLCRFNPFEGEKPAGRGFNRGVEYWRNLQGDKRIFYVAKSKLYVVNAENGQPVSELGDGGIC